MSLDDLLVNTKPAESSGRKTLKAGKYQGKISKALFEKHDKFGSTINLHFTTEEGTVFSTFYLEGDYAEDNVANFKAALVASGVDLPKTRSEIPVSLKALLGTPVEAYVGVGKKNGKNYFIVERVLGAEATSILDDLDNSFDNADEEIPF